jgi:hypothetical protein
MAKKTLAQKRRSAAARKAHVTRRARKAFAAKYPKTWAIAKDVLQGTTMGNPATYAAVKANLNRSGKYQDMAIACNF